jgi:hypothetical protein
MINFTLVPPTNYVAELLNLVPAFRSSVEFGSLDEHERANAGLVFSAFAKFMEASVGNELAMQESRNAIEHFASRNDPEVHNLLVTEVFESFREPQTTKNLLLAKSRQLYDQWIGN